MKHLGLALQEVARTSFTFADLMRRVIPEFLIQPVQSLDSSQVRPRAKLTLRLAGLNGRVDAGEIGSPQVGDVSVVIDVFEPPVQVRAIPACLAAKRADPTLSLDKIAAQTGYNRMAVKRALAYARRMEEEGLDNCYRELTDRPASAARWRHLDAS